VHFLHSARFPIEMKRQGRHSQLQSLEPTLHSSVPVGAMQGLPPKPAFAMGVEYRTFDAD